MKDNHILGLYVSYYLSRFNTEAYRNLGYGNQSQTHRIIGELLSVKPQTVKNWRDEFDPLFEHRAGWYQRPMIPSRICVAQALENLKEYQVRGIVKDILTGKINQEPDEEEQLLHIVSEESRGTSTPKFILRAPTGRAAEEYFQKYYSENKKPVDGKIVDCRDLGVGYDFLIETKAEKYYIEVKGISQFSGGILLTDKEWSLAQIERQNYFLCIISNMNEGHVVKFIQDPASKFDPKRNIYTYIQINWSLTQNQIAAIND